jgi:hypothetical protein
MLMNQAVPDCLITDYEDLIDAIELPDRGDRHIVAAAIRGGCNAIITTNLRDFPKGKLLNYGIEVQHPDEFVHLQFDLHIASVVVAAQRCRSRLRRPPKSAKEYLNALQAVGLLLTTAELSAYEGVI